MFIDITERVLLEQEQVRLEAQNAYLRDEVRSTQNFGDIVGGSRLIREVMQQIQLVAPTGAAVLLTCENGTGRSSSPGPSMTAARERVAPLSR